MSRQVNLGQIVPNVQIGTTTTSLPGTSASVENVGTSLNPILNFTIPRGEPGAIKMLIVAELPSTGADDTIYLVPLETPDTTGNNYAEYVYINNQWELLGKIGVQVDLTDYVKNTDYATDSKGGVVKSSNYYGTFVGSGGTLVAGTKTYSNYTSGENAMFISKGTLENVIAGKNLVSNTDYGTYTTGGTIKQNGTARFRIGTDGRPYLDSATYQEYGNAGNDTFISKGTLENVLTARIGAIDEVIDNINGEVI